jgi:hypothetical protein
MTLPLYSGFCPRLGMLMLHRVSLGLTSLTLALALTACALLDELPGGVPGTDTDEARVAAALREALVIGSERASTRAGQVDGYLANSLIRIALPPDVQRTGARLRMLGLGRQVDELEVAMNRAAEAAAGEAVAVFRNVVSGMRPADVYAVLNGPEDAATSYLRTHSEDVLRRRYQPIVTHHLAEVRATELYAELARRYNQLPLVEPITAELDDYVTARALDGLFTLLAEEEQRIRTDPVARTTQLLREVFGRR